MHRFLPALFLLLPALAFAGPPQAAQKSPDSTCRAHAAEILHALQNGTYDAAGIANFDAGMKTAIAAQMNQFWSLLTAHYGGFERAGAAQATHEGNQLTLIMPLVFAHGRENLHVTCNAAGDAIGLFLTPASSNPKPEN